jgi:hypothetical protein
MKRISYVDFLEAAYGEMGVSVISFSEKLIFSVLP